MNVPLALTLKGTDPDGDDLTYEIVSNPQNGVLSGTGANRTFTPATGFVGTTNFGFRVSGRGGRGQSGGDGDDLRSTRSIARRLRTPQSATTLEDTSKALTLRATDPRRRRVDLRNLYGAAARRF